MRVAVIGSRTLSIQNLRDYLPADATEIITGGAGGVDACAIQYAQEKGIPCCVIRPDYRRYGPGAPLRRNEDIIRTADLVIAFWDGESRGTAYVIRRCREQDIPCRIIRG